ncbi:MAG TPA: NUDIX hydrolase [Streptosporangiaceae bacterium]|jgi:8-oxo-dGTP pyrophosphatase MutT (NUDIX family)
MQAPAHALPDLVAGIVPADELEQAHQAGVLAWLESTRDIYRRGKPATPPRHLVSYGVLIDPDEQSLFLVDHRLAGLWLPPGGHVEPGEDPADTVRRETREELDIEAEFSIAGPAPVFLTVTRTAGAGRHTDVSLWYVISGNASSPIRLDDREFAGGRWWAPAELQSADPAMFDPHLGRFLAKIRSGTAGRPAATASPQDRLSDC